MNDLITGQAECISLDTGRLLLATVAAVDSSKGLQLTFDGQSEASQKFYKILKTGSTPSTGARVLVAKLSGTYVVLGQIGTSGS